MITTSAPPQGRNAARIAIVASIIVHLMVGALVVAAHDALVRFALVARHRVPPEEIVTTSSAIRIEKRAVPQPVPRVAVTAPRPPRRAQPPRRPVVAPRAPPVELPRVAVTIPRYQPPAVIAPRTVAHAATRRPELSHVVPKAERNPRRSAGPATRLALARPRSERAEPTEQAEPARPMPRGALSTREIAALESQFAQTIAQARARQNPMNVPTSAPAAPKRYVLQMEGIHEGLRRGEGYLSPLKSWRADGYTYYYVHYQWLWPDGTYEEGDVPWPIRYRPGDDPFVRGDRLIPLPGPLPGYQLPPHTELGRRLHIYFPDRYPEARADD